MAKHFAHNISKIKKAKSWKNVFDEHRHGEPW